MTPESFEKVVHLSTNSNISFDTIKPIDLIFRLLEADELGTGMFCSNGDVGPTKFVQMMILHVCCFGLFVKFVS